MSEAVGSRSAFKFVILMGILSLFAAVAHMVPRQRRPSAYGLFTGIYGIAWFAGSVVIGIAYTKSLSALVAFCVIAQLLTVPVFIWVNARMPRARVLESACTL